MSAVLTLQQVLSMGFYAEKLQQVEQHLHDLSLRQFEQDTRSIFDEKKIEVPTCQETNEIHSDGGTNQEKQNRKQQNKQQNDTSEQEEKIPNIGEALGITVDIEV